VERLGSGGMTVCIHNYGTWAEVSREIYTTAILATDIETPVAFRGGCLG
jgi:hypothetical protein